MTFCTNTWLQNRKRVHEGDQPLDLPHGSPTILRDVSGGAKMNVLVAVPVFNEERHLKKVLADIVAHSPTADVLVVDDGSSDATPQILKTIADIDVLRHRRNMGYGQSLIDAFSYASGNGYKWVITIDCDQQHEPVKIPEFIDRAMLDQSDIISGSRYMHELPRDGDPPADRRMINMLMTQVINRNLNLDLTDSFCGFKAHRVDAMADLRLTERGYAFPMQFWVRAAQAGLKIEEHPVRLIYNDPNRHFGGQLDDPNRRLRHYLDLFFREIRQGEMLRMTTDTLAASG